MKIAVLKQRGSKPGLGQNFGRATLGLLAQALPYWHFRGVRKTVTLRLLVEPSCMPELRKRHIGH